MAIWYVNSVAWTAITAWAATTAQAAGVLRRQLAAPTVNNERVFVCIVAGTTLGSEPAWVITKGGKTVEAAGPTWQECTGQPGANGDLTNCPNWTAVKNLNPGLGKVIQNNAGTYLFICSTAGTTGNGAEPSWTLTAGVTTADNAATWTCLGVVGNFAASAAPHARLLNAFTSTWGVAGDTFYVGDNHAETQAATMALTSPSTAAAQCIIVCVDHTKAPPASADLKTTATISTTGAFGMTIKTGSYYRGITFNCGSGAVTNFLTLAPNGVGQIFSNCTLAKLGTSGQSASILCGESGTSDSVLLENTSLQFGNTSDALAVFGCNLVWKDTSVTLAGAIVPTTLIGLSGTGGFILLDGLDLSALGSGTLLGSSSGTVQLFVNNCKLGTSYVAGATILSGSSVEIINSDSGATNYNFSRTRREGSHTINTALVRTGGASDGTTAISWQIVTTANATFVSPFESMSIATWNAVLSTNRTVTLFGIWNSASLPNNDQIWLRTEYLGSTGSPIASKASQVKADVLAAAAALTADSVSAWDSAATARVNSNSYAALGTIIKVASNSGRVFYCTATGTSASSEPGGYASAVDGGSVTDGGATFRAGTRFTLTVTLSSPQPALAGYIYAYIRTARASSTFWVDPKITLG